MTTSRSQKHPARPSLPMIAATTAALPAVVLSSLAIAQPAAAESRSRTIPATLAAAMRAQAQAATAPVSARIPAGSVSAAVPTALRPAQVAAPAEYSIERGDTISGIAGKFGLDTNAVLQLNNLQANTIIYPGQKIKLSADAAAAPAPAAQPSAPAGEAGYTVKAGDTLGAIAARHGVTLSEVFGWNGLNMGSIIYPGQKIKVGAGTASAPASAPAAPAPAAPAPAPAPASTGSSYTVKAGDTLGAIAARHGVKLSEVLGWNGLNMGSVIYPGQTIQIGGGSTAPAPSTPAPSAPVSPAETPAPAAPAPSGSYTIKAGDTLSGIAARNGVKLADILSANRLTMSTIIYPGQKLVLTGGSIAPASSPTTTPAPAPVTPLVPSSFLGFTYPAAVVSSANQNKALLNASPAPSREQMKSIVADTARRMGVDVSLALAFALQESGFDHRSVSPANAIGTMQVIPSSGEWASDLVGRQLNLLDPYDNATAGVAIIRQLVRTSSDLDNAIAGYYQGQYSVNTYGMYEDTKQYVASIKAHQQNFG